MFDKYKQWSHCHQKCAVTCDMMAVNNCKWKVGCILSSGGGGGVWLRCRVSYTGWPRNLENRENGEKKSLQGKIREFEILLKIREKSGNFKKSYLCKSKYSNFIAVQMWLLVVSFCHMLKIPAGLILLKGGVLVRWSTCLLYILTAFESVYDF